MADANVLAIVTTLVLDPIAQEGPAAVNVVALAVSVDVIDLQASQSSNHVLSSPTEEERCYSFGNLLAHGADVSIPFSADV